jgi:hypothetical protein
VLGDDGAVPHDVVLVDVGGFALARHFDGALALVVVLVGAGLAVVADFLDAVVLVPHDVAAGTVPVVGPAGLVAVGVIVEGAQPDVGGGVRVSRSVGVGPVVGGGFLGDGGSARIGQGVELGLGGDVVDIVVAHRELVLPELARAALEAAGSAGQAVQVVVAEALLGGAAHAAGRRDVHLVGEGEDVADAVVAVVEVLEGAFNVVMADEVVEPAVVGVVGVGRLDAVAELESDALLEFVVLERLQVGGDVAFALPGDAVEVAPARGTPAGAPLLRSDPSAAAGVVAVGQHFAIRQGQDHQAAEGVVPSALSLNC